MKKHIITIFFLLVTVGSNTLAQGCDTLIGYSKDDQYSIYIRNILAAPVINNPNDTLHGAFIRSKYFKTPNSQGISIEFYFLRCGNLLDSTVRVKVEFNDGITIIKSRSQYDFDMDGKIGLFTMFMGGDYGNNYEKTLFRTKSIKKISFWGNQIDSNTYTTDLSSSIDFMVAFNCLTELLD